jgi:Secretion system C-terminal sorting domain
MRFLVIILLTSLYQLGFSQNHYDRQWIFHNHNNFIFHEDSLLINIVVPPSIILDSGSYASNICDNQGNLLFYTGGCYVLNKEHAIMQNGDSITSDYALQYWCGYNDFPMRQNNTILPHPGDTNKYVIFNYNMEKPYDSLAPMPTAFYYHVVDMTQDNGLGAITQKKQVAIADTLVRGRMTATKHANGIDWWIVNNEWHSTCYYITPLTSQGVGTPHLSCPGPLALSFGGGQNTFNPIGSKYVRCDALNGLWIFDFDNVNGQLSNPMELTFPQPTSNYRGVCFSPNSRYLYVASYLELWQFDMQATDIQASLQLVGEMNTSNPLPGGGSLAFSQLGPDGKIYIAGPGNHYYLSRINKPNCPGTACDFRQWEIALLAPNYGGLPNLPHFNIIDSTYSCESVSTKQSGTLPFALYPNPTNGILWINFPDMGQQAMQLNIFDVLGRLVFESQISQPLSQIDISGLQPGSYLYSIQQGSGVISGKIVKTE